MGKGHDPFKPPKGLEAFSETGERIRARSGRCDLRSGARQRAEDLVALVTNLYGAGLERPLQGSPTQGGWTSRRWTPLQTTS